LLSSEAAHKMEMVMLMTTDSWILSIWHIFLSVQKL